MFEAHIYSHVTAVSYRKHGCAMVCKTALEVKMKKSVRPYVKNLSSGVAMSVATIQRQHHRDRLSPALERNTCVMERKIVPRVKVSHTSQHLSVSG